ncbi:TetR/AcrR family transcriptional regulator [Streptomyces sp. NBC_01465]|uniref:TetR/AcrR family transcriptional regulator n=1 Tax=Streptomyces sp. NBC_01465 TaxID=2903878 RepID=UPI002E344F0F|nr:TetR/AcrR family transcriptional regulator [Streptomyces sp. NBC_01465]
MQPPSQDPEAKRPYHHGDLRAALIETSFEILAESGQADFSVAKVAKRLGVSSGAPYRHFRDRQELLAAVTEQASIEAVAQITDAVRAAGSDPCERMAAAAKAHAREAITRRGAIDAILTTSLRLEREGQLASVSREMRESLQQLIQEASGSDPADRDVLFEQYLATVNGYAALFEAGYFPPAQHTSDDIAARAADAVKALVTGWKSARQ